MTTIGASLAARYWRPESEPDVSGEMPDIDRRPIAFAVLFGAGVIRVAGDGRLTLVMLPAGLVEYMRTGVRRRGR